MFSGRISYNSPTVQILLVALICFATVGMFLALLNLGAGGTENIKLSDETNATLYALFSVTSLIAGSVNNVLGPRLTLFLGSLGYATYVSGLWVYQARGVSGFLIFAGIIQGFGAALLWAAQGAIMMAYPLESDKGRMFSLFWVVFNCGSLLGAVIALAINIGSNAINQTSIYIYVVFFIIIMLGVCLTWTILPPGRVIRRDHSRVSMDNYLPLREELHNMFVAALTKKMLFLAPMCFASNFFYSYQSAFAFKLFDAETRSLNAVTSAAGQILGGVIVGLFLDKLPLKRRRHRGLSGLVLTGAFLVVTYGYGLSYQLGFARNTIMAKIGFRDAKFGAPIAILVLYSVSDALFQGLAYWTMGAFTNNAFDLARYAGVYKCIQAAGSAISFGIDAARVPLLGEQIICFALVILSLIPAGYVLSGISDTNVTAPPPISNSVSDGQQEISQREEVIDDDPVKF